MASKLRVSRRIFDEGLLYNCGRSRTVKSASSNALIDSALPFMSNRFEFYSWLLRPFGEASNIHASSG